MQIILFCEMDKINYYINSANMIIKLSIKKKHDNKIADQKKYDNKIGMINLRTLVLERGQISGANNVLLLYAV